jgi:hypothetical protein
LLPVTARLIFTLESLAENDMSFVQQAAQSGITDVNDVLDLINHVIVILGVPAAIFGYFHNRDKDRQEVVKDREEAVKAREARELATYTALDDKYLEFEQLCLRHPELDVFDVPDDPPRQPTPMQQKRELVAFTMLFSLFERAFYMYRGQASAIRKAQWTGWDQFIGNYCARENFQRAWQRSGSTFDEDFQLYMNKKVEDGRRQLVGH